IGTAFASRTEPGGTRVADVPDNAIVLIPYTDTSSGASSTFRPVDPTTERALETILPRATWTERRAVLGTINDQDAVRPPGGVAADSGPPANDPKAFIRDASPDVPIVADPATLALVGLAQSDADALQRTGVMVLPGPRVNNASATTVTVGTKT